jgi:hypothetical protein
VKSTDYLTQGSANKYSQWTTNGTIIHDNTGNVGTGITNPSPSKKWSASKALCAAAGALSGLSAGASDAALTIGCAVKLLVASAEHVAPDAAAAP